MKKLVQTRGIFLFVILAVISLACGAISPLPDMPTFPPIPPSPSMNNAPTGSSPLSGDWQVNAEFGHFAFTVDPDGKNVITAVFDLSNWTCGGTTLTTGLQSVSQWPISNNEFTGDVNLNGNFHTMRVHGTYDEKNKNFTGTWEQDAHGTTCSGDWEAIARQ